MKKLNITPAQLQVFVTIAEVGSITAAGHVLNLTQSGVSHALLSLEKSIGLTLFRRERSGVSLTTGGKQLLASARTLLAQTAALEQAASMLAGEIRGSLTIGCFPSVGGKLLPNMMRGFLTSYENIDLSLKEGTDTEVIEWLATQQIDVGFVTLPNEQFDIQPFIEDEFVVLLPADHRYASQPGIGADCLADEAFIMSGSGCEPLIHAIFATAGCYPNTRYMARDINTILALVDAGLGISIVPSLSLPSNTVRYVRLEPSVKRHIGIAVRSWETATPLARAFVGFAREMTKSAEYRVLSAE